jgi:hypothetical protein
MSRSLSAISLCLFGALSGGLLPACSSKKGGSSSDDALQEPAESGSLQLALTARGASGALYRLRDASFSVRRDDFGFFTSLSTENDPLATTIESTLPVGNFFIDIFGGFSLEKVENGTTTRVNATLLSPAEQVFTIQTNEETFVGYRFETNGEIVDFGQGRLIVTLDVSEREGEARREVIETGQDALRDVTLRDTLAAALRNLGTLTSVGAEDVYHALIDSYNAAPGVDPSLGHCDDEQTNGSPSLNGFPLACPRLEGQQFDNLDSWFPLAFVNRLDLAPSDGAHCGQQRIIFANNDPIGNGRMFMIVEAQVPNPTPECGVSACRPIAELWSSLATVTDPAERGRRLSAAFLETGVGPFGPFINAANLGPNGGQIRTNNFNDFQWTLREFHLQPEPALLPVQTSVAEAPNGELWNDLSPLPQGEACRASFLASIGNLQSDNLATLGFPVASECEDAESPNDFFRQAYETQLNSGSGDFSAAIDAQVAGTGLSASDIANRARFAGSCMGCHIESSGASLGRNVFAPPSNDFVQVSEFSTEACAGGGGRCFAVSEALRTVFLPHRIDVQRNFLQSDPTCGGVFPGVDAGPPPSVGDAGVFVAARLAAPQRTLGGQPVVEHAH